LKCLLFNARSLKNKILDLHCIIDNNYDLILITESWLNYVVPDNLLVSSYDYSVFRCDRAQGSADVQGGGVCILSNNSTVKAVRVSLPPNYTHLEMCVIDIINNASCPIRLFAIYRPPSGNREPDAVQNTRDLCNCIQQMFPAKGTVTLCGDLNFPDIDWSVDNCLKINDFSCSGLFLTLFYSLALCQFVSSPTRNNNILDVVFSNDFNSVFNVYTHEPFSTSDHLSVKFELMYEITVPSSSNYTFYYRNFNNANWDAIRSFLRNYDFDAIFNNDFNVDSICNFFYSVLYYALDNFVPVKAARMSLKRKGPRYPYAIRKLFNKKSQAWRIYRTTRTTESRLRYNKISAESRRAVRSFISQSETRLISNGNLGQFYQYANKKFCSKSSIALIRTKSGILSSSPREIAETFQETFTSYFVHDNNVLPPITTSTSSRCDNVTFSPNAVKRAIARLKTNSKGGPDKIPPIFFKHLSDILPFLLARLFTVCFNNNYLPADWKRAYVSPIFKKGCRNDSNNYRPIALTSTMCKLMESVIKEQLMDYLLSNNLLSTHQHAFIAKHSTASNLLECLHDWTLSLNSRHSTDIIYIDFSRAFDSIVFSKLIFVLKQYGITG